MFRKVTALAAAGALAGLGFVAAPSAFADTGPSTPGNPCDTTGPAAGTGAHAGGNCQVPGSITISQTLSLELSDTTFAVAPGTPNVNGITDQGSGSGFVYVLSNDPSGYAVDEQSTDYSMTAGGHTYTIPATELQTYGYAGCKGPYVENTPCTFQTVAGVSSGVTQTGASPNSSAWDAWLDPGYALTTATPTLAGGGDPPAGTYDGTVTWSLWGN